MLAKLTKDLISLTILSGGHVVRASILDGSGRTLSTVIRKPTWCTSGSNFNS